MQNHWLGVLLDVLVCAQVLSDASVGEWTAIVRRFPEWGVRSYGAKVRSIVESGEEAIHFMALSTGAGEQQGQERRHAGATAG